MTEEHEVNAAVILARNIEGRYLMVQHYRGAIDRDSLELPRTGRITDAHTLSAWATR